jgi:hypothetical protein
LPRVRLRRSGRRGETSASFSEKNDFGASEAHHGHYLLSRCRLRVLRKNKKTPFPLESNGAEKKKWRAAHVVRPSVRPPNALQSWVRPVTVVFEVSITSIRALGVC